jgi:CheY-like chemotaxis protein/DNA-binding CsgD family transcriptional regulator
MSIRNKVLIVDDDGHNLSICKLVLDEYYTTEVAVNGEDAVSKAESFMPDIILMDWDMPVLNGLDATKNIKSSAATRDIQIIMMTGIMVDQNSLLEAFQSGIVDFIKKPFDSLELKARINSVMQSVNYYRSEIDSRNKELVWLTLILSENAVMIENALKQIEQILKSLSNSGSDAQLKLLDLRRNLSSGIIDSAWKQFERHFKEVHPDFYKNISSRHPSITPAELKLASLLSINLDTKEIAAIFHQSVDSVKVSRTRLRKKLELRGDINLTSYLMNF